MGSGYPQAPHALSAPCRRIPRSEHSLGPTALPQPESKAFKLPPTMLLVCAPIKQNTHEVVLLLTGPRSEKQLPDLKALTGWSGFSPSPTHSHVGRQLYNLLTLGSLTGVTSCPSRAPLSDPQNAQASCRVPSGQGRTRGSAPLLPTMGSHTADPVLGSSPAGHAEHQRFSCRKRAPDGPSFVNI